MAVIRVNKTSDYTVISNRHFREKEMSLRAKGLLSLMLSLPDDWDYSIIGLVSLSKDGKASVMNALNELEKLGYLKRTKTVDDKGRFTGYDYDIYEHPYSENPYSENPNTEKPNTEKPYTENQPQLNTKESNTDSSSTESSNTQDKKKERTTSYDDILAAVENDDLKDLFREYIKMRKMIKAPMTDRALKMLIAKVKDLEPLSIERQKKLLETAILNNWKSVYPLRDGKNQQQGQQQEETEYQRQRRLNEDDWPF